MDRNAWSKKDIQLTERKSQKGDINMHVKRNSILATVVAITVAVGLWAAQNMNQKDMNNWSYSKVKKTMSNPQTAKKVAMMAKKNKVMLMGGVSMGGTPVTMRGELTGADCYLSAGKHGHDHALCAKACVSHGGPIVFLESNGTTYLVLPPMDGAHYPLQVLNDLGKPDVTVHAHEIDSHGIKALSVDSVQG
jgi:hypothetical protein